MTKQTIGEFIATLRKANGYTQQEVADRLGISNRTLSGWECDKVLPDILLLPVLAELYGVTVDEILAGERISRSDVSLSGKSEKKIFKSKIARFGTQCWTLMGIIITCVLLVAVCAYIEITTVSRDGFPWWRVLLVGLVPLIICLTNLFADWKGLEASVDDSTEQYGTYCLVLRKKLSNCLYILAATNILAMIVVAVGLVICHSIRNCGIVTCVVFGIVAIALFLIGWFLYKRALVKWGGEKACSHINRSKKFIRMIALIGIIPITFAAIVATVLSFVRLEDKATIYENASAEDFVKHMESFGEFDTGKRFPLSELAKTAKLGEEFDLGDGYVAVYRGYSFTITNENISMLLGDGTQLGISPFSFEAPRYFLIEEDGSFSFFNVRYWQYPEMANNDDPYVIYENYSVDRAGEGMAYVHTMVRDYSSIVNATAFFIIALDLVACASLCVWKRYKFAVVL
ncbi:MAG: helix-turn-helix transcriptional regulator [Clostridiales bacterium]|nr:helix-turn-helix transcriptional regulator [Clostridiales bacterium]